jgi:hypothetical protein
MSATTAKEARAPECTIGDLINEVYRLTAGEVELMWRNAPRMPMPIPLSV